MHNPPHPGLVLREYLGDLALTTAATHLRITRVTLSRVLNGKAGISAAMAIRLAAALGTTPELWMNMQSRQLTSQNISYRFCFGRLRQLREQESPVGKCSIEATFDGSCS
jgi:addiction module HigA family antidote